MTPPYLWNTGLTWQIKEQYKAYNTTSKKCNLCFNEKLAIIDDPDKNVQV